MSDNRVEQWKRNLLDLSMRNPLLNAREGRKFLPIKQGGIYSNAENETAVVPYSPPETDGKMSIESGTPRQAWLNYHDERNMNHKQTEM